MRGENRTKIAVCYECKSSSFAQTLFLLLQLVEAEAIGLRFDVSDQHSMPRFLGTASEGCAFGELAVCLAEVQGRGGNEDFPLRMHRYRGLLEGRYRRPVIALALLIEPLSKTQSRGFYRWEGYGTKVSYEFPVFRIYEGDEEVLKASENPFDWAHLAGLRAWKSRGSEARKLDYLKEMLYLLEERGWSHADKAQLLVFMEGVIHLTEDASSREYEKWESALEEAREAGRMYVSIMERKGIEKGLQLGRTEGMKIGEAKGIQLGRTETARNLLQMGFDAAQIVQATGLSLEEVESLSGDQRPPVPGAMTTPIRRRSS